MPALSENKKLSIVSNQQNFQEELTKPGLVLVDCFSKFAGPCEALAASVKRWKIDHGDLFHFVQVQNDEIESLQRYRNRSIATFLIKANSVTTHVSLGVDLPTLERVIKEQIDLIRQGMVPKPCDEPEFSVTKISDHGSSEDLTWNPPVGKEYTLALIKPEVFRQYEFLKNEIASCGFEIIREKKFVFTKQAARDFYSELSDSPIFNNLLQYITSGPIVALILCKENCIENWRDLLGPSNSTLAKDEKPNSLRARFGTNGLQNAFHGSKNLEIFKQEADIIFEPSLPGLAPTFSERTGEPPVLEKTLVVINPNVVGKSRLNSLKVASMTNLFTTGSSEETANNENENSVEQILYEILTQNLEISNIKQVSLTVEQVAKLFKEAEESVKTSWLSGESVVAVISGDHAVEELKELLGPLQPQLAKSLFPKSLCARYCIDDETPGFHVSETSALASEEINIFFNTAKNGSVNLEEIREISVSNENPVAEVEVLDTVPSLPKSTSSAAVKTPSRPSSKSGQMKISSATSKASLSASKASLSAKKELTGSRTSIVNSKTPSKASISATRSPSSTKAPSK